MSAVFPYKISLWQIHNAITLFADPIHNRRDTELTMLVVRVILGESSIYNDTKPLSAIPCKVEGCKTPGCRRHHEKYDSAVVDCYNNFRGFLMLDARRCYPQYLVTYDRVRKIEDETDV